MFFKSPNNEEIIPEFIRYIYGIPQTQSVEGQNATLCVAEFQDDNAYLKVRSVSVDLDAFRQS